LNNAEYRGLTVEEMKALRREAHENNVYLKVIKNTLLRRAVQDTDFECLDDSLVGPLAFAASEDPVAVAKILNKYAKEYDALEIKAGAMSGSLMSEAEISALAKLPSRVRGVAAVRDSKEAA